MRNIIVAYDNERAIGIDGELPWKMREMKLDMQRFRSLTTGATVIMGRKTLESVGRALPERRNIVLTHNNTLDIPGVEIAHSVDEAYNLTHDSDEVFVIGGAQVYEQALATTDRIYATEVHTTIAKADAYFPKLGSEEWKQSDTASFQPDEFNIYPFDFVTYERR